MDPAPPPAPTPQAYDPGIRNAMNVVLDPKSVMQLPLPDMSSVVAVMVTFRAPLGDVGPNVQVPGWVGRTAAADRGMATSPANDTATMIVILMRFGIRLGGR